MSGNGNGNNQTQQTSAPAPALAPAPTPAPAPNPEPSVVSGWEHSTYAHKSDRYSYIGKDEDSGEPEWIDHGPKGGRR